MKPGDLVQVRVGLWSAGDTGMVIGPAKDIDGLYDGYLDVLFHDGVFPTHPSILRKIRKQSTPRAKKGDQ